MLGDVGFRLAFVLAAVGTVLAWVVVPRIRRRQRGPAALGAIAVVAALVALRAEYQTTAWLAVGVALLALSAATVPVPFGFLGRAVARVAGALAVAHASPGPPAWMRALVLVTLIVAPSLARAVDRRAARLAPLLVLTSAFGVYAGVADTEVPKVLLGAWAPVALVGLVSGRRPGASTAAAMGLLAYAAVTGGHTRPGSVIGALACIGVFVVVPFTGWRPARAGDGLVLVAVHVALVAWVARVAGLHHGVAAAVALAVPGYFAAWLVLVFWAWRSRGRRFPPFWWQNGAL